MAARIGFWRNRAALRQFHRIFSQTFIFADQARWMEAMREMNIILIVVAALSATSALSAPRLEDWQRETLALIKHRQGVLDARWRSPEKNALWVSVELDTYHAESITYDICSLLKDAGSPADQATDVFIFDPASYRGSGWPRMTFQCH